MIHSSRENILKDEFKKPYFLEIEKKLLEKKEKGETIYPPEELIFNAFNLTSFDAVKVVILGQDPYHGRGQAHGLSFSVPDGVKIPPSLRNIFKEIDRSVEVDKYLKNNENSPLISLSEEKIIHDSGNLEYLAKQGVLLLNAILTVTAHHPASHRNIGRQIFTDTVIRKISEKKEGVIFLLRGKFSRQKKVLIDMKKHIVLETTHPSPFSAHKGFLGSGCFHETNKMLLKKNEREIQRL